MAFPLLFIGIILFVTGVTGKTELFQETVSADLQGDGRSQPFAVWVFAVLAIAMIGVYKPLRPISDGFLTLIVVAFILTNGALVSEFSKAFGVNTSFAGAPPPLRD